MVICKEIEGFNKYHITTNGEIWLEKKPYRAYGYGHRFRKLKASISSRGYRSVVLRKDGKSHWFNLHRLVAKTFIPNPENKPQINHIDCNKLNNTVSNLEWCTQDENMAHAAANNLISVSEKQKEAIRKLKGRPATVYKSKAVQQFNKEGDFINEYFSMQNAAERTGVSFSMISNCCRGKSRTAGGYIFKYSNRQLRHFFSDTLDVLFSFL